MQTLSGEETLKKIELSKVDTPKLRGVQRVLEELLVPYQDLQDKPASVLTMDITFEMFSSFFAKKNLNRMVPGLLAESRIWAYSFHILICLLCLHNKSTEMAPSWWSVVCKVRMQMFWG